MRPPIAVGQLLDGKYWVEQIIGEGGFGVVLRVRHEALGVPMAIKVLLDSADPVIARRFELEARATAQIGNDHVTKVHDVGRLENGDPYMVMELLDGSDLDELVRTRGPLPIADAAEYILQACEPLAIAHALGFVHRDIKPSNLFLTKGANGGPFIKLLDFGISKQALRPPMSLGPLTATGAVLGSPHFISPEQLVSSRDVDLRSDIWSLGATLHELLSAAPPFDGATLAEVLAAVMRQDPVPLRETRADVPEPIERAVLRCLEKDALLRFGSVIELAEVLVPFAGGRSVAERFGEHIEMAATVRAPTVALPAELMEAGPASDLLKTQLFHDAPTMPYVSAATSSPALARGLHQSGRMASLAHRSEYPRAEPRPASVRTRRRWSAFQVFAIFLVVVIAAGGAWFGWRMGTRGSHSQTGRDRGPRDAHRGDEGDAHLSASQVEAIVTKLERAEQALDDGENGAARRECQAIIALLDEAEVKAPSRLAARAYMLLMKAEAAEARPAFIRTANQRMAVSSAFLRVAEVAQPYAKMRAHGDYPFVGCACVAYGDFWASIEDNLYNHRPIRDGGPWADDISSMRSTALRSSAAGYDDAIRLVPGTQCAADARKALAIIEQKMSAEGVRR